ncbi:DoxX family membrane protein [Staphylococcus simulans]|uniref:DoxX family membrane protein n=1 Tax=Staphylococcus simulans TaxID=1286 RepID=UPI000D03D172|nr:DoxX family membrane protein [Staphylococcus simulans]MCD8914111.1 DoxX family membrane protein [Staphylococcus simulans]
MKEKLRLIWQSIIFVLRIGSGGFILAQGWEKLTGGFKIEPLIPVVIQNEDSPVWFKLFFEHIVMPAAPVFNLIVPLGEIAIGLGLLLGILSHIASFFGAFVMLNYILSDMIFTYPLQLAIFIILLMNKNIVNQTALKSIIAYIKEKGDIKREHNLNRR